MRVRYIAVALAAIFFLASPTAVDSCAIGPRVPVFTTRRGPADPRGEFFQGRIGVLVPSFDRLYLIAAYRYLSGRTFSNEEADAFLTPVQADAGNPYPGGLGQWAQARRIVPGTASLFISVSKSKTNGTSFFSYQNCLDDAFVRAGATLHDLADRWGAGSPEVREWLAAQDQVFSNCSGNTPTIPDEPAEGMNPSLAAHRQYQIAAAHFYAGEWEAARRGFERVARNKDSPWASIAPYLVARVSLREGMVDEKPAELEDAARRFQAIVNDPAPEQWHAASEGLLDFTNFRIRAWDLLTEDASALNGERRADDLGQSLADFEFLFAHSNDKARLATTSDLADWLLTLESGFQGGKHAVEQWRRSGRPAWLIAALLYASNDADISDLVKAARAVRTDDVSYESAVYYGIGSEIRRGRRESARSWADQVLKGRLLLSSRNRILSERLKLARDWSEFLRFAPRTPEPGVSFFDNRELLEPGKWAHGSSLFDRDATQALNSQVPLALWLNASRSRSLPTRLQVLIAQGGFVRAIVLDRLSEARAFMQRIVEMNPGLADRAHDFLSTTDDAGAHFAAIMLLLRSASLNGILWPDDWDSPVDLRRAQFVGSGLRWGFATQYQSNPSGLNLPNDFGFLSTNERKQADLEWKLLSQRAGCSATYVENEALKWSVQHPDDKRVPEALHLLVLTTFRGCRELQNDSVGKRSREAFLLLKQRYPDSPWAKMTKYWYK
jgi:hypothetical protein